MATTTIGAATPLDASDDNRLLFTAGTTETLSRALNDTPTDFLTMQSLDWSVEYSQDITGDDFLDLGIRIVNGATILAAADAGGTFATVATNITNTTDVTTGPTAFGYINTTADKTAWDGASVELQQTYTQEMGPDNRQLRVDYVQFDAQYTQNIILNGTNASESTTATGFDAINVVSNGTNVTTSDSAVFGVPIFEHPGFVASTSSSASAGAFDTSITGSNAVVNDNPGDGISINDAILLGDPATSTDSSNLGNADIAAGEGSDVELNIATAGQQSGAFIVPGNNASETTTPNVGVINQIIFYQGLSASDSVSAVSGNSVRYLVSGNVDENGRYFSNILDESGNTVIPIRRVNEDGEFVDSTVVVQLQGSNAVSNDIANVGITPQYITEVGTNSSTISTANVGDAVVDANLEGVNTTTTDTASVGQALIELAQQGVNASTTDVASFGTSRVESIDEGVQANSNSIANAGSTFVEINYAGASASESTVATGGTTVVGSNGVNVTTTDTANVGQQVGAFIVQGIKGTVNDVANDGIEFNAIDIPGTNVTTTDTESAGAIAFVFVGSSDTENTIARNGVDFNEPLVIGVNVTTTDTANQGLEINDIVKLGLSATSFDTGVAGAASSNLPPDKPTILQPAELSTVLTPVSMEITYSDPDADPLAAISIRRDSVVQ